jgi:hypothetical protein
MYMYACVCMCWLAFCPVAARKLCIYVCVHANVYVYGYSAARKLQCSVAISNISLYACIKESMYMGVLLPARKSQFSVAILEISLCACMYVFVSLQDVCVWLFIFAVTCEEIPILRGDFEDLVVLYFADVHQVLKTLRIKSSQTKRW